MACFVYKQIPIMPLFQKDEIFLEVAEKGSEIKIRGACVWMAEDFEKYITGI